MNTGKNIGSEPPNWVGAQPSRLPGGTSAKIKNLVKTSSRTPNNPETLEKQITNDNKTEKTQKPPTLSNFLASTYAKHEKYLPEAGGRKEIALKPGHKNEGYYKFSRDAEGALQCQEAYRGERQGTFFLKDVDLKTDPGPARALESHASVEEKIRSKFEDMVGEGTMEEEDVDEAMVDKEMRSDVMGYAEMKKLTAQAEQVFNGNLPKLSE